MLKMMNRRALPVSVHYFRQVNKRKSNIIIALQVTAKMLVTGDLRVTLLDAFRPMMWADKLGELSIKSGDVAKI